MALRATQTFFVGNRKVSKGQLVNPKDPVAVGRGHLFEDTETVSVPVVEQASRAPGERRRITMPKSKPAGGMTTRNLPGRAPEPTAD